ncbi:MAG: cobalt-precorrin-6A reductase [Pseudooceanicola sp.]
MILLLAGTAEGRELAARLAAEGIAATASFAGAVDRIGDVALPRRVGGFGGDDGFRRYLAEEGIGAVIDATHPFADRITGRTHAICAERGLPFCRLERPGWTPVPGDDWTRVAWPEDLPGIIPAGARIFLPVGRKEVHRYHGLVGRDVLLRSIDPPGELPEGWRAMTGRPPFPAGDEAALFSLTGIDWIVSRNAGGAASHGKIAAARKLGLKVAMIDRPGPPPGAHVVETVEAAMDWARAL